MPPKRRSTRFAAVIAALDAALVTGVLAIVDRLSMLCERLKGAKAPSRAGEDGDVIAALSADASDPVQAAPAVPGGDPDAARR